MTTLTFEVRGVPPVAWQRARLAYDYQRNTVRHFTATESADWKHQLATAAVLAMRQQGWKLTLEPVTVTMVVYRQIPASTSRVRALGMVGQPCPIKPDADNFLKQLDALNSLVWKDDAQIVSATVTKEWARAEDAGVAVRIETRQEAPGG